MAYTNQQSKGWKVIYEGLRRRIESGEWSPGSQLPTEAQLVAELGASKLTIHRALRELSAAGLVRRVERVGSFVAEVSLAAAKRVGLFLPTNQGFLELRLLSGISEGLTPERQIVLYATDNDSVTEYELLLQAEREVDAILIMPTCHPKTSQYLQRLSDQGIPVICIDRDPPNTTLPSVTSDNYAVTKRSLEYLHENGHRRIAYFGQVLREVSSLAERHKAFEDFFRERDLGEPSDLTRSIEPLDPVQINLEVPLYEDAILRLTAGPNPVTAALCANEHYLGVLLDVLQGLPAKTRERFEIVSFCDWPSLSYPIVRTHVVRQDARAVGLAAAALLNRALESQDVVSERLEVPAEFEPSPDRLRSRMDVEGSRAN